MTGEKFWFCLRFIEEGELVKKEAKMIKKVQEKAALMVDFFATN